MDEIENTNKDQKIVINQEEVIVPVEGSLGLLAYGYRGLMAWRKQRAEHNYKYNRHLFYLEPNTKESGKKNS